MTYLKMVNFEKKCKMLKIDFATSFSSSYFFQNINYYQVQRVV